MNKPYCCVAIAVLACMLAAAVSAHSPTDLIASARERPKASLLSVQVAPKELRFRWTEAAGARYYKLLHNPDGQSGYVPLAPPMTAHRTSANVRIGVHLRDWERATYILVACNKAGCTNSNVVWLAGKDRQALESIFAPANRVVMSADGTTLIAAHPNEPDGYIQSGAVFIYRKWKGAWTLEQTLKPPQPGDGVYFGRDVALSADGRTLAVSGHTEALEEWWPRGGAVFIYSRAASNKPARWVQTAKIVAPNQSTDDWAFGMKLDMSSAGDVLVVGSPADSRVVGDATLDAAGSAFVYRRRGGAWVQEALLRRPEVQRWDQFGAAVSVSGNGKRIVVLSGEQNDIVCDSHGGCGQRRNTLHTFVFDGATWMRENSVEAAEGYSMFGGLTSITDVLPGTQAVELDWAGTTLAVGVLALSFDGPGGAVLIYRHENRAWTPIETLRAPPGQGAFFGNRFAFSPSGRVLACETGDETSPYPRKRLVTFVRGRDGWSLRSALESPASPTFYDGFGLSIATDFTGRTVAVSGARIHPDPMNSGIYRDVIYIY